MKLLAVFYLLSMDKFVTLKIVEWRIVGGEIARTSQFPFSAAIYATFSTGSFFCGGAIISNLWILTSAQCIDGALQCTIRIGSNNLEGADPNRVTVATSTYTTHPDYIPDTLENDIALIRLRLPINFNEYISAIALPERALDDGASVTAIGWGQQSDQNPVLANGLHYVSLVTIPNKSCRDIYGDEIVDEMVCVAGGSNEGICTGDSGGPLIEYRTERAAVHVAVATFISTQGCESVFPSGFTRTYPYVDWIKNVTAVTTSLMIND